MTGHGVLIWVCFVSIWGHFPAISGIFQKYHGEIWKVMVKPLDLGIKNRISTVRYPLAAKKWHCRISSTDAETNGFHFFTIGFPGGKETVEKTIF